MKHTKKMHRLLERMAGIERMERGKLCPMGGRPHYNHQTWQNGKNLVRYVRADEADFLQEAIDGYHAFMKLAEEYVDEVIAKTRRERETVFAKPDKPSPSRKGKTGKTRKSSPEYY